MLQIKNLNVYYGGIHALRGVSIDVKEGDVVSIIGSNGAGKSTLLNCISGIVKPKEGEILYKGLPQAKAPHKIVESGICQVPEGRIIFANLTVKENLYMGAFLRKDKDKIEEDLKGIFKLFPRLDERINQVAGTLSGGEQQMLAMGRGIMSNPNLVLLDEPSLGLAPLFIKTIFEIVEEIQKMGKTILLVEQNAYKALSVANKAYILEQGVVTLEGNAKDLLKDERIQEAYLGKKH